MTLVLSRKRGERLMIGNEIEVKVLEIRGNVVRLGVEAPRGVRVLRAELDKRDRDGAA